MIFYCHDLHEKEDKFSWHRQRGQAMASAREHAKTVPRGLLIEVEKVILVNITTKDLVLAVLRGSGYVSERETIAEVKGKFKPSRSPEPPQTKAIKKTKVKTKESHQW